MYPWKRDVIEDTLIAACLQQNLDVIVECKKKGADVSKVCSSGRTPLGIAAEIGNEEIIKILLDNENTSNESTSAPCPGGTSNLGYFVMVHGESTENLDSSKSNQMCITPNFDIKGFNDSLIHHIPGFPETYLDSIDIMPDLEWDSEIEQDEESLFSVPADDPWAENYLWYAGILSQLGSILTEKSSNTIDSGDQIGLTPLHYAAAAGHIGIGKILLKAGCKINCEDCDNFTPLHLAAAKDYPEMLKLLLTNGANANHRSTDGITALHVAASRGLEDNARALISSGAQVNALDLGDRTPLYDAVRRRHYMVVKLLIEAGAKVNFEEIHGYTPLYEAVYAKDVRLVEILLNAGSKLTQSHHLLHYAVFQCHEEMVRLLLEAGAIVNLRNEEGDTPLMLAVRFNYQCIASLLLQNGALVHHVNHVNQQTAFLVAVCHISNDCKTFSETLTLLEGYGWDMKEESNALHFAIMTENDHAASTLIRRWHIPAYDLFPNNEEILCRLLRKDKRFLVELLVYAGSNLCHLQRLNTLPLKVDWWSCFVKHPLSLQQIARIAVRSTLKPNIYAQLQTFRLPQRLKSYILLEDVFCSCELYC